MRQSPTEPENTMIVDRYEPVNLFEMVPKLQLEKEPELARLDVLLDDDELFSVVKGDLIKRYPNSARLGRHSTPVEVILRMLVKRLYNWSYEQTEHFVCDSIVLRQFCRLYLQPAPDDTTLIRWANAIGAPPLAALNDRAVELARTLKVTRGRKLRTDATVVETNIHYPTDDTLLVDGVRTISRLVGKAKSFVKESLRRAAKGEPFRDRPRRQEISAQNLQDGASPWRRSTGHLPGGLPEVGGSGQGQHEASRTGAKYAPRGALSSKDLRRDLPLRAASGASHLADPPEGARRGAGSGHREAGQYLRAPHGHNSQRQGQKAYGVREESVAL
jgi:hypothetical protein